MSRCHPLVVPNYYWVCHQDREPWSARARTVSILVHASQIDSIYIHCLLSALVSRVFQCLLSTLLHHWESWACKYSSTQPYCGPSSWTWWLWASASASASSSVCLSLHVRNFTCFWVAWGKGSRCSLSVAEITDWLRALTAYEYSSSRQ